MSNDRLAKASDDGTSLTYLAEGVRAELTAVTLANVSPPQDLRTLLPREACDE